MKGLLVILLSAMLVDNFVLSKFMGICAFLGVSKKLDSAVGMGAAVTFVMLCATLCTYPIYTLILVPMGLTYLKTIAFILGVTILNIDNSYGLGESLVNALGAGLGFTLALIIFSGVRQRVNAANTPAMFKGVPATLIAASIVSVSFMGLSGLFN